MSSLGINDHVSFMMFQHGDAGSWDADSCIYEPLSKNSLLPDLSQTLAVKTLLHICKLPFHSVERTNADFMSDDGGVPVVKTGSLAVCGFQGILEHLQLKRCLPSSQMSQQEQVDVKCYTALVQNKLMAAEVYATWCSPANVSDSSQIYKASYSWPLGSFLAWQKQRHARHYMSAVGLNSLGAAEVYGEAERALRALSIRLGSAEFFGCERPCELDALVFGHLHSILTTPLQDSHLMELVSSMENLTRFCHRMAVQLSTQARERGHFS